MKYFFLFSVLLFVASCNNKKAISVDPSAKVFDSLAVLQKESWDMPGLALGVIKDNLVIYQKGIGQHGLNDPTPMSAKSIFHMASVSKPFVATAIMQLVEQGKVNLDDPLTEYMPYFKMADSSYRMITIRHVLTHASGIPDEDDYEWYKPQYDEGAAERYARGLKEVTLDFDPGTQNEYSNTAFDILANVISNASGLTFERYMQQNILEPAGMVNSTFYKPDVPEHLATHPHVMSDSLQVKVNEHYPYNRRHAPSSTLNSNVEDMMRWAKVYFGHGNIEGTQIFSKDTYQQLTTPTQAFYGDSIALGWFVRYIDSTKVVEHWGGDDGYLSYFGFVPDQGMALTLMANNDYYLDGFAVELFLDQLIKGKVEQPWKLPIYFKLKDLIFNPEGIEECKRFYLQERDNEDSKYLTANWTLNYLGYVLLDKGYGQKAEAIFKFNIELEPQNAVWHDSLGDCYRKLDSTDLAIEYYEKALEIDPGQDYTREKLDEMITGA